MCFHVLQENIIEYFEKIHKLVLLLLYAYIQLEGNGEMCREKVHKTKQIVL